MTMLLVALGAMVGAPIRFVAAHLLDARWPHGTLAVNVTGSALVGAFAAAGLSGDSWALLATGFCGALTSYSSFCVQAVERGPRLGGWYVVATAVCSLAACAVGYVVVA